jgi:phosphotransferase family enzyme
MSAPDPHLPPMIHESLTPARAAGALASLGVRVAAGEVRLERRDARWLARLPGERLAWFAADEEGRAILETERRLLGVLAARCRFAVPRVLAVSPDGGCEVRTMIPGACDPPWMDARVRDDPRAAAALGAGLGALLAELHTAVRAEDVAGWLPPRPDWPEPAASLAERLPRVVDDPGLHARAAEVMARYEALLIDDGDRVLAHTDLGFHNVGVDPASFAVGGVFDWGSACWTDRHLDFRHLAGNPALLDAVLAAYEPAVGRAVSRERIALHVAALAVGYLAYRDGVAPEVPWCGRTLDEDLTWTRRAVAGALAASG